MNDTPAIFPAVEGHERHVLFVKDGYVVGDGLIDGGDSHILSIVPFDLAAKEFFAQDEKLTKWGRLAPIHYSRYSGEPQTEQDRERALGTIVVGRLAFNLGILPPRLQYIVRPHD